LHSCGMKSDRGNLNKWSVVVFSKLLVLSAHIPSPTTERYILNTETAVLLPLLLAVIFIDVFSH